MKAILLFLILFCVYDLKCQTNFRPGYVITNENDTVHGLIDYRGDARNSRKCDFMDKESSIVKEFMPLSIKGYRFDDGKFYISKSIKSDGKEIQVFLEFLVNGISDLYYYSDGIKLHYFIEKVDGQLFELTNDQKILGKDGAKYIHSNNRYIGLLKYAFADCQQIFPLINKAKLEDKSLIEITKKYHEYVCKDDQCIIYEKQLPAVRLTFATFISMNASFLKFNNNQLYEAIHFNPPVYPMIGFLLNTSLPKANDKLSFQVSGEFGKNYFYGTGFNPLNDAFEEVHLHTSILKVKGGLKYTYPKGKIRPTLMLGGNVLWLLYKDGRRVEDSQSGSTVTITEHRDVFVADTALGYTAVFGVDYHLSPSLITFFNLGYESSTGSSRFMESQSASTVINTINLHAGIYF